MPSIKFFFLLSFIALTANADMLDSAGDAKNHIEQGAQVVTQYSDYARTAVVTLFSAFKKFYADNLLVPTDFHLPFLLQLLIYFCLGFLIVHPQILKYMIQKSVFKPMKVLGAFICYGTFILGVYILSAMFINHASPLMNTLFYAMSLSLIIGVIKSIYCMRNKCQGINFFTFQNVIDITTDRGKRLTKLLKRGKIICFLIVILGGIAAYLTYAQENLYNQLLLNIVKLLHYSFFLLVIRYYIPSYLLGDGVSRGFYWRLNLLLSLIFIAIATKIFHLYPEHNLNVLWLIFIASIYDAVKFLKVLSQKSVAFIEQNKYFKGLQEAVPLVNIVHTFYMIILSLFFTGIIFFNYASEKTLNKFYVTLEDVLFRFLTIFFIIIIGRFISKTIKFALGQVIQHNKKDFRKYRSRNQMLTLMSIVLNIIPAILWALIGALVLVQLGVDGGNLVAWLIIMLAFIGFVGRNFVSDILAGLGYVLENIVAVGDHVNINNSIYGFIERLTLQSLSLRDYKGVVHTINYSKINLISSNVDTYAYAVIDIGVGYECDLEHVMTVMNEIGAEMRKDYPKEIIEDFQMFGVQEFGDSSITIRARFKTIPMQQWTLRREYNLRMKKRFDEEGISIPFPQRDVHLIKT